MTRVYSVLVKHGETQWNTTSGIVQVIQFQVLETFEEHNSLEWGRGPFGDFGWTRTGFCHWNILNSTISGDFRTTPCAHLEGKSKLIKALNGTRIYRCGFWFHVSPGAGCSGYFYDQTRRGCYVKSGSHSLNLGQTTCQSQTSPQRAHMGKHARSAPFRSSTVCRATFRQQAEAISGPWLQALGPV